MVGATLTFAIVALGTAAVLAQVPEANTHLEAREFNNELEYRAYVGDDLEARELLDELADVGVREPEVFGKIEARDLLRDVSEVARELEDDFEARQDKESSVPSLPDPIPAGAPAAGATPGPVSTGSPVLLTSPDNGGTTPTPVAHSKSTTPTPVAHSKTVTTTITPIPTPCTLKELRHEEEKERVRNALATVRAARAKDKLTPKEKRQYKKAKKYLHRVRVKKVKASKKMNKKCRSALRKANISQKQCTDDPSVCDAALKSSGVSSAKCKAASRFLKKYKKLRSARKSEKNHSAKPSKTSRKSSKLDEIMASPTPTTTVGSDGVTTVLVSPPGPTCTASDSKTRLAKQLVARDMVGVFAREYDFDNLD